MTLQRRKPKGRIDYTKLAFPKVAPERSPAYLRFVRDQVCAAWDTDCNGVTEAAHLEVLGKGIKASDFYTIPLCTRHHRQLHSLGLDYFESVRGVRLWEKACKLVIEWVRRTQ